jgi:hypothetical protein
VGDPNLQSSVEATVRGMASAAKALRLYPPTSPIPRQSLEAAALPLRAVLDIEPVVKLGIVREGFIWDGTPLSPTIAGSADLADMLRSHGIAEITFTPSCDVRDLLSFLTTLMHAPEVLRPKGGFAAALSAEGVNGIKASSVSLSVSVQPTEDADVDEFFRSLAADPEQLATWLSIAGEGDPGTLAEGLDELASAAGPEGIETFLDGLAGAFEKQTSDVKDVLLGLGMEEGAPRALLDGMLGRLPEPAITSTLTDGVYGKNMLSLSSALTRLPLGTRLEDIIADVRASLPALGKNTHEVEFLDHMLSVRRGGGVERALTVTDTTYAYVAEAARIAEDAVRAARDEVRHSMDHTAARSVPTMLSLIDQQHDFNLYVKSLDSLATLVPRVIIEGDLPLAVSVLREIADREQRTSQPWPELTQRLRQALATATGRRTMAALLTTLLDDPDAVPLAREVLNLAEQAGRIAFVEEALDRNDDRALDAVDSLLGRRSADILAAAVPHVGVAKIGPLVRRLAKHEGDGALHAIEEALKRPEEMARMEAVEALAGATNPAVVGLVAPLLRDRSVKVVSAAARTLARLQLAGAAEALAVRLSQLDVDNHDFAVARELIACLSHRDEPVAEAALSKLADRKSLIKRGRFVEVQQIARDALRTRSQRRSR